MRGILRALIVGFLIILKTVAGAVLSVKKFSCLAVVEVIFLFTTWLRLPSLMVIKLGEFVVLSVSKFAVGGVGGCL